MHTNIGNLSCGHVGAALKTLLSTFQIIAVMNLVVAASLVLALVISSFLHRDD
jgi:hypothetical protein